MDNLKNVITGVGHSLRLINPIMAGKNFSAKRENTSSFSMQISALFFALFLPGFSNWFIKAKDML